MRIWGLHPIDIAIVAAYLVGMMLIGKILSKRVKDTTDFYLAGRKLGKVFQFFLSFGAKTDASGAVSMSSETYRQGVGGVWIQFQSLFWTPFAWFYNVWARRVRLVTNADLYVDRLNSTFLAGMYAALWMAMAMLLTGWSYVVAAKTMEAMMIKPQAEWTAAEQQQIENFKEMKELKAQYTAGALPTDKRDRYTTLKSLENKGRLRSFISHIHRPTFYIVYCVIVGTYIVLGGMLAAVVTDAVQSILILFFSLILIPVGLAKLGGFSELHAALPDYMFNIFGSAKTSEYTWYSIAAIIFAGIVWLGGGSVTISGAAKDERAARVGQVTGAFAKRFIMVAWILCALIAVALYSGEISDPDTAWGVLTNNLLGPGLIGLMLAGILAAQMSTIDASAIGTSALFVRNLYSPLFPGRSEKHYVGAGRCAVVSILIIGIVVALFTAQFGIIAILKDIMTIWAVFNATGYLIYFWRRLTRTAVLITWITGGIIVGILPRALPACESLCRNPALLLETPERTVTIRDGATEDDVQAGRAQKIGQIIEKPHKIAPISIYFDSIAHSDPWDTTSAKEGVGRFNAEVYIMGKLGLPVENFTKAGLLTTRFLFAALFPFILMIILSHFTRPPDKKLVDRFYVKMKTPVAKTLDEDAQELEVSYANPTRFDHLKLFPKSNWEMCKWTREDTIGWVLCWLTVCAVLVVFWLAVNIGS